MYFVVLRKCMEGYIPEYIVLEDDNLGMDEVPRECAGVFG